MCHSISIFHQFSVPRQGPTPSTPSSLATVRASPLGGVARPPSGEVAVIREVSIGLLHVTLWLAQLPAGVAWLNLNFVHKCI